MFLALLWLAAPASAQDLDDLPEAEEAQDADGDEPDFDFDDLDEEDEMEDFTEMEVPISVGDVVDPLDERPPLQPVVPAAEAAQSVPTDPPVDAVLDTRSHDLIDDLALPDEVDRPPPQGTEFDLYALDDDDEMRDFTDGSPAAPVPKGLPVDTDGKQPLGGHYEARVVATSTDSVIIELPVLVTRSRVQMTEGLRLIAAVFIGEHRVLESQQLFVPASVAELTPTVAWFKFQVPVDDPTGQIKILVRRSPLDGGEPQNLFVKGVSYAL